MSVESPEQVTGDAFFLQTDALSLLTDEDCANLIRLSEAHEYSPVQKNKFGDTIDNSAIRSDYYVSWTDAKLVKHLQSQLQSLLPTTLKEHTLDRLDYKVKFNRYSSGQDFKPHNDTPLVKNQSQSRLTLMIFLNDDFSGGQTRFFDIETMRHYDVIPKTGKVLMFDQNLYHAGLKVVDGTKYTLRLDVMYKDKDQHTRLDTQKPSTASRRLSRKPARRFSNRKRD